MAHLINETFDGVFCINLMRRPDRRAQAEAEFAKHGIYVEWVPGVDGKELNIPPMTSSDGLPVRPGDIGCVRSHLKTVKLAKINELENYCIFEDDVVFHNNFNELFPVFISQLPNDWGIAYLGGSHNGTKHFVSNNIVKAHDIFTTHAVAFKHTVYDALIEVWEKQNEKVDLALATLQTKFNTYAFEPFLVGQRASYSDILEKETYYKHLDVNKYNERSS